jgi:hypothetical protein
VFAKFISYRAGESIGQLLFGHKAGRGALAVQGYVYGFDFEFGFGRYVALPGPVAAACGKQGRKREYEQLSQFNILLVKRKYLSQILRVL